MLKKVIKKIIPRAFIEKAIYITSKTMLPYYKAKYGILVRKNTSDFEVYRDIFILRHYNLKYKETPKLIVDCGAYVGYSAIYFASRYPNAKIMAFEPSAKNFEVLKKNTEKYKNVFIYNLGIWYKNANLKVIDNQADYAFTVEETDRPDFDVKAITVDEIIEQSGLERIDILKIDIEGAEKEIFSQPKAKWMDKVQNYIFEFHDRIKAGCSEAVFDKLLPKEYEISTKGEYTIFQKKNNERNYNGG
jgi:FkbM family methyltransferase